MTTVNPLCFGQLSVWRFVERLPRHLWSPANVGHLCTVPDGPTLDDVQAVLAGRAWHHPTLRTTYDFDGADGPVQILHPEPGAVVGAAEVVELGDRDEARARSRAEALTAAPFTLDGDFGWRAEVMTAQGKPAFVALAAHHMVTDGWSIRRIGAEIDEVLGDGPIGASTAEPAAGPGDLAREQHSSDWASRRASARAYWQALVDDFGDTAPTESLPPPGSRVSGTLDLGPAAGAVTTIARRIGVFPQGVILGLFGLSAATTRGVDRCLVPLMSSNRFKPPWRELATSMNQQIPLGFTIDPDEKASAFLRRVHQASAAAYKNGSYDVDQMVDLSTGLLGKLDDLDYLFNFMGSGWPEPLSADDLADLPRAEPRLGESSRIAAARLYLIVNGHEALTLAMHADASMYPLARVGQLLRAFEESLRRMVTNTDTTVGELIDLVG